MTDTARAFDQLAAEYEGQRRRLIPSYDAFHGALVDSLEFCGRPVARMLEDRAASVESQLRWLRDAGFSDADCLFKNRGFAVLVARRAG